MIYLRRFDKLRTLNMSGNPLCEDPNYRLFAIAYLSHLVYLDFRLVDADTVTITGTLTWYWCRQDTINCWAR